MDYDSSTRVSTINYGREGRGEGKGVNEVRFNPLYLRMSGLPQTGEAKPIYLAGREFKKRSKVLSLQECVPSNS